MKAHQTRAQDRLFLEEKTPRYYYVAISFGALGLAALLVVTVTLLLDAPRSQLPLMAQRWTGFLPLVVPPIIGAGAGVMGLATPGHHKLLSGLGLLLNLGFGLSFAGVLMLAG